MYSVMLDGVFGNGDYDEFVGASKTKKDAEKLVQLAIIALKKSNREEPDSGWDKSCFEIVRLSKNGLEVNWIENINNE